MKKFLLPVLIACLSALPTQAQTVLTVDVSNVFNNLKEVQTEIAKLNTAADEYRGFLTDRSNKLKAEKTKLDELVAQSQNQAITTDSRDTFQKEAVQQNQLFQQDYADAQKIEADSNSAIKDRQDSLVKAELEKIRTVVKQIAAEKKASVVLNSSDLVMLSSVLYTSSTVDITQDVVAKLNADYAATAPAASAAPAAASGTAAAKPADTSKK